VRELHSDSVGFSNYTSECGRYCSTTF